ncbi:MAG: LuxR C-terminal-related transcriptional regulator [Steroidobacteraceae bacterium]
MNEWLVRSKLSPSIRLRRPVPRAPLMARLDGALDAQLTLVQAPAGYGKTSLLAQWFESLKARGVPAAWLSLDEHDSDPFQFLNYLVGACQEAGFAAGIELIDSPHSFSGSAPAATTGALVTALNRCTGPHVVILDDLHRAESPAVGAAVNQLLASRPPHVHFVISTRQYPQSLPTADLRAHDELLVMRQSEIEFSPAEIESFLADLLPAQRPPDWSSELHARTEGWPIALQTVRRWLAGGASIEETLAQISGRSSDLEDYFVEQVFDALPVDEQRFLLDTSILERVNGELADALRGNSGSWQLLERLERHDLFVHRLDRERTWYRYHRLFSEFLKERLRRAAGPGVADLHRSASRWFHAHGYHTEAVQHAMSSADHELLADILERLGGWRYALMGHVGVFERTLRVLPDDLLATHPRIALADIYLKARRGEHNAARAAMLRLVQPPDRHAADTALAGEIAIMRSLLDRYAGNDVTPHEIGQLEALGVALPREDHLMHAVRCNLLCAAHARIGRADESFAAGEQAIAHFRRIGSLYGEAFIYFHEGYARMAQGRMRDAEALFREGRDLAEEHFGAGSDLVAVAKVFLAEIAYERNETPMATQLLDRALPHIEQFDSWLEVYVAGYQTALKLAHLARDPLQVARIARRVHATASSRMLPGLEEVMGAWLRELAWRDAAYGGDAGPATNQAEPPLAPLPDDALFDPALRHAQVSAQARHLMRDGDLAAAEGLLATETGRAHRARHLRAFVSLSVLLSMVRLRRDPAAAGAALDTAVAAAVFEGLKRPFIDAGPELLPILGVLLGASETRRGNRLRDRFLTEVALAIRSESAAGRADPLLSPREHQVLGLLVQGRSNGEIAAAVNLSPNTVKFHLKNLFEKLSVGTRQDAVTAAIRQGLI